MFCWHKWSVWSFHRNDSSGYPWQRRVCMKCRKAEIRSEY